MFNKPTLRCGTLVSLTKSKNVVIKGVYPGKSFKYRLTGTNNNYPILYKIQEGGRTLEELITDLNKEGVEVDYSYLVALINELESLNLVVESDRNEDRYHRQSLFFEVYGNESNTPKIMLDKLRKSKVTIIGAGGTGNWVSLQLAAAGIGKLNIIDFDKVELTNLNRQILFNEVDIGQNKVEVLKRRLLEFRSDIEIEIHNMKIKEVSDLSKCCIEGSDIVIGIGPPPSSFGLEIATFLEEKEIPYLVSSDSLIGPLYIPKESLCYSCLTRYFFELNTEYETSTLEKGSQTLNTLHPSFIPLIGLGSSIVVEQTLRFLTKYLEEDLVNKVIGINFKNYETKKFEIKSTFDCSCLQKGISIDV